MTQFQLQALYELLASQQKQLIELSQQLAEATKLASERGTEMERLQEHLATIQP